jgi:hypothetical protein
VSRGRGGIQAALRRLTQNPKHERNALRLELESSPLGTIPDPTESDGLSDVIYLPARRSAIGDDSVRFAGPGLESHCLRPQRTGPLGVKKLGITKAQTIVVGRFFPKAAATRASIRRETGAAYELSRAQRLLWNASAARRYGIIITGEPTLTRS